LEQSTILDYKQWTFPGYTILLHPPQPHSKEPIAEAHYDCSCSAKSVSFQDSSALAKFVKPHARIQVCGYPCVQVLKRIIKDLDIDIQKLAEMSPIEYVEPRAATAQQAATAETAETAQTILTASTAETAAAEGTAETGQLARFYLGTVDNSRSVWIFRGQITGLHCSREMCYMQGSQGMQPSKTAQCFVWHGFV
jgi:hypothetical protein